MNENQKLMSDAKALNLTYEQAYTEMSNVFPTPDGAPYIGSLANHFRGKLKSYGTVDGLIESMDNYCLNKLIKHFSGVIAH